MSIKPWQTGHTGIITQDRLTTVRYHTGSSNQTLQQETEDTQTIQIIITIHHSSITEAEDIKRGVLNAQIFYLYV